MRTFSQFLEEALISSLIKAAARQFVKSKVLQKAIASLPVPSNAPKKLDYQKLYHGTTKPASQAISKDGWKTDVNVSAQKRGSGVYVTPDKKTAIGYAAGKVRQTGGTPDWNNIDIRRFNMPKNVYDDAMKRQVQNPDDWANISQVKQVTMKPSYANKIDITDKPNSAIDFTNSQRDEIKRRVAAGLKNKANQDEIKRELGINPIKEQKTFSQFIAEAEQQLKMVRVYHGTSKSNAKKIKSDGFNDSEYGVYGSGVYSSTSRNVARRYSRDAGAASGKHDVDSGVVSSIIPSKKVKTIRQSSPESQEGRNTSKELRKSGQPAVRVKNAATGHETAKPGGGHEDEADYIISDTKVVNKGIEKNPRVFRPTKDQKLDQTNKTQMARDYYRGKPGTERPYVDRKKGTKKIQTKSAKKI